MKIKIILAAASALTLAASANAATLITSSFGTTTGSDDDNQAGPIRGVAYQIITTGTYSVPSVTQGGYTATHALSATDTVATQVQFQSLTWQRSSSTAMSGTFYVAIADGLTVDSNGNVTNIGTILGVSTNSITDPASNAAMTWSFNNTLLNVGSTYQFVLTNTANPTVAADFVSGQFELKTATNLLTETTLIAGNNSAFTNRTGWEPVFSMTYNAIPEPSAALFGGLGMLALLRRRRA